jgi:hypothetical protein
MTALGSTENGFPPAIRLSGLGLHLREWTDDDLPVMVELFDEPQVHRWTPLPVIRERDGRRASLLTWCHDREPRD